MTDDGVLTYHDRVRAMDAMSAEAKAETIRRYRLAHQIHPSWSDKSVWAACEIEMMAGRAPEEEPW